MHSDRTIIVAVGTFLLLAEAALREELRGGELVLRPTRGQLETILAGLDEIIDGLVPPDPGRSTPRSRPSLRLIVGDETLRRAA